MICKPVNGGIYGGGRNELIEGIFDKLQIENSSFKYTSN